MGIADAAMKPVEAKAVCYIISDGRLLVFRHRDFPMEETGVQVPAGGIKPGESAAEAALREATEETGLSGFEVVGELGVAEYDVTPYRREIHRRHFVHLRLTEPAPQRWNSAERDGVESPIRFECFWIPVAHGHVLAAGQGMLLGRLPLGAGG